VIFVVSAFPTKMPLFTQFLTNFEVFCVIVIVQFVCSTSLVTRELL